MESVYSFVTHLTMLSVANTVQCQMVGFLMNNKMEIMEKLSGRRAI
jgi:hypothetical protein